MALFSLLGSTMSFWVEMLGFHAPILRARQGPVPRVWRVLGTAHELRTRRKCGRDQGIDQQPVADLRAMCALVTKRVHAPLPAAQ